MITLASRLAPPSELRLPGPVAPLLYVDSLSTKNLGKLLHDCLAIKVARSRAALRREGKKCAFYSTSVCPLLDSNLAPYSRGCTKTRQVVALSERCKSRKGIMTYILRYFRKHVNASCAMAPEYVVNCEPALSKVLSTLPNPIPCRRSSQLQTNNIKGFLHSDSATLSASPSRSCPARRLFLRGCRRSCSCSRQANVSARTCS
jgi:hypothetical protein